MKRLPRWLQGVFAFCSFFVTVVALIQALTYYFDVDDEVKHYLGEHRAAFGVLLFYASFVFAIYWVFEEPKP